MSRTSEAYETVILEERQPSQSARREQMPRFFIYRSPVRTEQKYQILRLLASRYPMDFVEYC